MKYRPIDTKTESRRDFIGKTIEIRSDDWVWIEAPTYPDVTPNTWLRNTEYREVLPDDPQWITDRAPTKEDATAAGWVAMHDGTVGFYEYLDEEDWRTGWCKIILPKGPPQSPEDKAFEEWLAGTDIKLNAKVYQQVARRGFDAGIQFARDNG